MGTSDPPPQQQEKQEGRPIPPPPALEGPTGGNEPFEGVRNRREIARRMRGGTEGDEEEDAEDRVAHGQRSLVAFLLEEGAALAAERCWFRRRRARKQRLAAKRSSESLGASANYKSFDQSRRSTSSSASSASSDSSSSASSECSLAASSVSSASSTSCWSSCDEACGDGEEARRREARAAMWVARAADVDAARTARRKLRRAERGRRWPRPQTLSDETLIAAIDRYVAAATGGACACGAMIPCACPAVAEYLSALHQPSAVPPGAADTNAVDEAEGLAPLHAACLYHSPSVIAHLLSRGADPGVPAGEGAVARGQSPRGRVLEAVG